MLLRFALAAALLLCTGTDDAFAGEGEVPRPAPRVYATHNYGLTFVSPAGTSYCPLPADWVGSDHGTILFLRNPARCYGGGYASSGRNFFPEDVARLRTYYGYWVREADHAPPPCRQVAMVRLLGASRPVCEGREEGGLVTRSIQARYGADIPAEVSLTLVTKGAPSRREMAALAALAASIRTCIAPDVPVGEAPCPKGVGTF
ncbi:MAG TPA: hypothetical protein VGB65_03875 [Allosphingosinicella sp.]|jgi:hypothetical protein